MDHSLRVHFIQHVSFESPAELGEYFKEEGLLISSTHLYRGETLPKVESVDLVVIMGGPMGIHDDDIYPWLGEERRFIKEVIRHKKKVIGVCLGAQLLADALGARVYKGKHKEIGWLPIYAYGKEQENEISSTDLAYLNLFTQEQTVFHWHGDTFDLPKGAIGLASSDGCDNQGFIYGGQAIGLQFHIEMNQESVRKIADAGRDELEDQVYIQDYDAIVKNELYYNSNNQLLRDLVSLLLK